MNDAFDNSRADKQVLLDVLGDGVRMNQTRQDAYERVMDARAGSLANASDDFLLNLVSNLHGWIGDIEAELKVRIARAEASSFDDADLNDAESYMNRHED